MGQEVASYGAWKSPITADLIIAGTVRLEQIRLDGTDVYWTESRPEEGGRSCIVRKSESGIEDVIPVEFNARTRIHEYGGASFIVDKGVVYFTNFADNQVYKVANQEIVRVTNEPGQRYADFAFDEARNRIICVREDHANPKDVINTIASIHLETGTSQAIVFGNDFYSTPRLSPDGTKLAWLTWNHPNMPWDSNELWVADVAEDGTLQNARTVAGGEGESLCQPEWSPTGELYFVSDRSNWWNLYRVRANAVEPVAPLDAEFGAPHWVFGISTYSFADADTVYAVYAQNGSWHFTRIDVNRLERMDIELPYTYIEGVRANADEVVFRAGAPTTFPVLASYNIKTGAVDVLRNSSNVCVDPAYLSIPSAVEFPTENGQTAHAFYYAPKNPDCTAPNGERPPLIVHTHGGPTSAVSNVLNLSFQFFTSRGFAVLDVNYGGSTGYGREYRERLKGQWGVVDVNDCCNGALYLVTEGLADENKLAIVGGSAGGYTTLSALAFRDVFKAGASYFGVSDLELFVADTHKYESQYLHGLIGPWPERRDLYRERSAIHHTDNLSCPMILFQGLDDKIVPPNQAELMVEALQKKGIPVAYIAYEGEGHGFRMGKNIKRTLEAELYFYSKVFGFDLADEVHPVHIDNLETQRA